MRAGNRREQILDTAAHLFIGEGFEGVTMGDIARVLGVSRPTIYSYFASTSAILDALLDAGLERLWGRLEPLIAAQREEVAASLAAGIPAALEPTATIFAALLEERGLLAVARSGGSSAFQRRRRALLRERLAPLLEPYLPPGHDPLTAVLLIELWESMAFWTITEEITDIQPVAASLARFVAGGMRAVTGNEQ